MMLNTFQLRTLLNALHYVLCDTQLNTYIQLGETNLGRKRKDLLKIIIKKIINMVHNKTNYYG